MNDSAAGSEADPVATLAALLHSAAESADRRQGRHRWDSLTRVVNSQNPTGSGGEVAGAAELAALRRAPGDAGRANALARVLLALADDDEQLRNALRDWRSQQQIWATESAVSGPFQVTTASTSPASPEQKSGSPRAAEPGTEGKPQRKPWYRRIATYVGGAIIVPVLVGVLILLANGEAQKALGIGSSQPSPSGTQGSAGFTGSGLAIKTQVSQGLGCSSNGDVFPSSITPGLSLSVAPDREPTHKGKTWVTAPSAFGAVSASPVVIRIYLTGPSNHAVIITGIKFHVFSRRPEVKGTWLNSAYGCGAAGVYRYGVADLNAPPPYWVSPSKLPDNMRVSPLQFPYTATANSPEELYVNVQMEDCECTWDAVLSWIDGSIAKSKVINNHGHPFVTTSVAGLTGADWYNTSTDPTPTWTSTPWPFR
jgi:hypothetical protein